MTIAGDGAEFTAGGKTIEFAGYLRAYVEGSDDPQADLADREAILPSLEQGERVKLADAGLEPKSHTTQPPARYSEAALTRALEELGIGRPSTYASIIDTIQARDYVFKKGSALVPTWTAFAVTQLLENHLKGTDRLRLHRPDGRRFGRHQPRRTGSAGLSEAVLLRQRPARA